MKKYLFISVGGFVGAVLRFALQEAHLLKLYNESFPLSTFIINVTGSFLLGLFLAGIHEVWKVDNDVKLGITAGLLGGYTTFSTYCSELVTLLDKGEYFYAVFYMLASPLFGLAAVWLGTFIIRRLRSSNKIKA